MALDSMKEIFDRMEQEGKPFWEIVLETDMDERQVTRNQSMAKMLITWQAMADAADSYTGRRKSVSGLVGGMVGMILFRIFFFLCTEVQLHIGWCVLLGFVGAVLGQLGDLSFSCVKRQCGIKDYGRLLPGHGGVLDRFDSVIFAAPVTWMLINAVTLY